MRFQNYRATFTVLDEARVSREWLNDALLGKPLAGSCPPAWQSWVESRRYLPLISERIDIRSRDAQLPVSEEGRTVIRVVHQYFNKVLTDPVRFEECAVALWRLAAASTGEVELTRPWRDGGRDAVGSYLLGPPADRIAVEFALEAKCYAIGHAVGVKETSRLISRLRFRQFGVFVTTSYFHQQAYKEIRQDQHPVVLICARDIVDLLARIGVTTGRDTSSWLQSQFPPEGH
jgi:hypothetical protein